MTQNLLPLYGCAVTAIAALGLFAGQNRRSGWKRERASDPVAALHAFYTELGIHPESEAPETTVSATAAAPAMAPAMELAPLTPEEEIGFSTQLLKLRMALGSSAPVTEGAAEEIHQLVRA